MINISDAKPKVRLSIREIEVIRTTVRRLIGDQACIRIFGSRVCEDEKEGDIDILIETEGKLASRVASACRLVSELQMQLGDQKIDVIIIDPQTRKQPIHQIARETGVML